MSNSPSDEGTAGPAGKPPGPRLLVAIGGVVLLLILLPPLLDRVRTPGRSDVRGAADAAAYELERTPIQGLGVNIFHVQEALSSATRSGHSRGGGGLASRLRVDSVGEDSRGDLFEITNSNGEHPACLAIRVEIDLTGTAPVFPTTSVTDGPCASG